MTHAQPIQDSSKSIKQIFLIVLLAIIADQTVESVLIETIAPIRFSFGSITNAYLLSTMPFALIIAAWSDFHCRRKTMIFSLTCLSISALVLSCYPSLSKDWVIYTALAFKGIGGNVTPVALASLATIISPKKFTIYLAVAICAYSAGILTPIYLHSFKQLPLVALLLAVGSTLIVIRWFREREFDDFQFQNNTASFGKFFRFLRKDLISIIIFSVEVSVMLALFGYIASEISFYQILLRGQVLEVNPFYSDLALKIGVSYYSGTFLLYLLKRKRVSDMRCLIAGVIGALISVLVAAILNSMGIKNAYVISLMFAFFSISFALLTPCLFSVLSQIRKKDEQGKIYGFLDTFDTLAAYVSVKYIAISATAKFSSSLWFSFILMFISAVFILAFIRDVKERRRLPD